MNNKKLGNFGELIAEYYLKLKGYKILERNFLVKGGEIDIIAEKNKTTVIVEVKTRKNLSYGDPEDAVNYYKKKNIIYAVKNYLKRSGREDRKIRFDVIGIVFRPFKIRHIKDAFYYDDL